MRHLLLLLAALSILSGCKTDLSGNSYSVGSVGAVNRAVEAVVVSKRAVRVEGTSEAGAAAGAVGGAIAGGAIGGDSPLGVVAGVVGGAIVGSVVGGVAEKKATNQTGIEYVVKTDTGALLVIVQGPEPRIEKGDSVVVLYGVRARIIPFTK